MRKECINLETKADLFEWLDSLISRTGIDHFQPVFTVPGLVAERLDLHAGEYRLPIYEDWTQTTSIHALIPCGHSVSSVKAVEAFNEAVYNDEWF